MGHFKRGQWRGTSLATSSLTKSTWDVFPKKPPLEKKTDVFMIWVFPKIGVPQNGWFISWNTLLKWMIWGVLPPLFLVQHPYVGFFHMKSTKQKPLKLTEVLGPSTWFHFDASHDSPISTKFFLPKGCYRRSQ